MSVQRERMPDTACEESMRVAVVRQLDLVDSPPQERFDRITRLARTRFGVPIAEINLIDADRQFTKSPQRLGQSLSSKRVHSFCDVAIGHPGLTVVPDATADPRFDWKDPVTGERHIRFYAAAPLRYAGYPVGTLCLADTVAHPFSDDDRRVLLRLGRWAEEEIVQSQYRRMDSAAAGRSPG